MPLALEQEDTEGRTGEDLRSFRDAHTLVATGLCRRLLELVPSVVTQSGEVVTINYTLALWLVLPTLTLEEDAMDELLTHQMVGWELLGATLDELLLQICGRDATVKARTPSVLRAQLRRTAFTLEAGHGAPKFVVAAADLYEVFDSATPVLDHIKDNYDWLFLVSYRMLLDPDGKLSIVAEIEVCIFPRFVDTVALGKGAPYNRLASLVSRNAFGDDAGATDAILLLDGLPAEDLALEFSEVLTRALPVHDFVAQYATTTTSALSTLRGLLHDATKGEVTKVTQRNVRLLVPHDELLSLVVGYSMGAAAAMAQVTEILRLGLRTTAVVTYAIDTVPTATLALDYMLAPMRAADVRAMPPSQRLQYFVREVEAARRADAASSGSGAGAPRSTSDDERAAVGALGYPGCFQGQLRGLIGSAGFASSVLLINNFIGAAKYDVAITAIFVSGHLPLVHALCGQLRSLPNVPLVDRIVRVLVPLGGQWVSNTLAKALLPPNTTALKQRLPAPRTDLFKLLTKGALDEIPWEDACIEIIAFASYKKPEGKVPVAQRFKSLERLKMVQPGISALLEAYGKLKGEARSFDRLIDKVSSYDQQAAAAGTPESSRVDVIARAISSAISECATLDGLVLTSKDPTATLPTELIVDGSGAMATLDAAFEVLPQQASMVTSLVGALTPAQAKALGYDGVLRVPGLSKSVRTTTAGAEPEAGDVVTNDKADLAKKRREAAGDDRPTPMVGCSHSRLCKETPTHIVMGDPAGAYGTQEASKAEIDALLAKHDRKDACKFSLLSRSKFAGVCCPCPQKAGHERHDSVAHVFTPAMKRAGLLLLAVASVPGAAPMSMSAMPRSAGASGGVGVAASPRGFGVTPFSAARAAAPSPVMAAASVYVAPVAWVAEVGAIWADPGDVGQPAGDGRVCTRALGSSAAAGSDDLGGEGLGPSGVAARPVPVLGARHFEQVGGHIFLPIRYPLPFSPEVGLPADGVDSWFGEPEVGPDPQTREGVLAVAARWVTTLFPGLPHVVPFGQFEDVGHAGGQVTGAVLPYQPGDGARPMGGAIRWAPLAAVLDSCQGYVARLVAARMESFARPAPLLRPPEARVGAMAPTAANVPATLAMVLGDCMPMSEAELISAANVATSDLRNALAARITGLRSEPGEKAAFLVEQLGGWMAAITLPTFGDIAPSVIRQAARLTDPRLAKIPLPAAVRPVTTPCLPPLPARELAPPAAIPGWAHNMSHCLSIEAHDACLRFMRKYRKAMRHYARTGDAAKAWGMLPNAMAVGVDNFTPWMAALAVAGHAVHQQGDRLVIVDVSHAPATTMNRAYIKELFDESGCTDRALYDAALTHGFCYLLPSDRRPPMVVLQKPLMSFFASLKAFRSIHDETLRLSGKGPKENRWFVIERMDGLDSGVLDLPGIPCSFCPSGSVPRGKEDRWRPIKNSSAPHTLLLTMAPPCPPLHDLGPGRREPVTSINAATGVFESKGSRRLAKMALRGGKLPAAHQRHTPGERRAAEDFGEVDTLEVGPLSALRVQYRSASEAHVTANAASAEAEAAKAVGTKKGGAGPAQSGWLTEAWAWPQELKPFFIDVLLATCVLGYGAELCGVPLLSLQDDVADMFFAFPLMVAQCLDMNLFRLDPSDLNDGAIDAALCVVQARCMEMGVAPSSNWAQRLATQANHGFMKRFNAANEPLMRKLEELHPKFAVWREGRREVARRTGRDEAACAFLKQHLHRRRLRAHHLHPVGDPLRRDARRALRAARAQPDHGHRGQAPFRGRLSVHRRSVHDRRRTRLHRAVEGAQDRHCTPGGYRRQDAPRRLEQAGRAAQPPGLHFAHGLHGDVRRLRHLRRMPPRAHRSRRADRAHGKRSEGAAEVASAAALSCRHHGARVGAPVAAGGRWGRGPHAPLRRRHPRHQLPGDLLQPLRTRASAAAHGGVAADADRHPGVPRRAAQPRGVWARAPRHAVRAAARCAGRADGDGRQGEGPHDALAAAALHRAGAAVRARRHGGDGVWHVQRGVRCRLPWEDRRDGGDHAQSAHGAELHLGERRDDLAHGRRARGVGPAQPDRPGSVAPRGGAGGGGAHAAQRVRRRQQAGLQGGAATPFRRGRNGPVVGSASHPAGGAARHRFPQLGELGAQPFLEQLGRLRELRTAAQGAPRGGGDARTLRGGRGERGPRCAARLGCAGCVDPPPRAAPGGGAARSCPLVRSPRTLPYERHQVARRPRSSQVARHPRPGLSARGRAGGVQLVAGEPFAAT